MIPRAVVGNHCFSIKVNTLIKLFPLQDSGITFEVKFSMLEIYNEIVRDLLDPKGASKKGGLKVRQHPKRGFYGKNNS